MISPKEPTLLNLINTISLEIDNSDASEIVLFYKGMQSTMLMKLDRLLKSKK